VTLSVVLVDDHELVRGGLAMMINAQPDMRVAAQLGDGAQACHWLRSSTADVVLMDVRMPVMDGVAATAHIHRMLETPPAILVLTTFDDDEYVFGALKAGASGFLLKDAPADQLLEAIREVHAGNAVVAPAATRRLLDVVAPGLPDTGRPLDRLAFLTERERQVAMALAGGKSNAEIGQELFLAPGTVKIHVANVLAKLGLGRRIDVVIWAYEKRIILPSQRDQDP
jgi:DNA-binding NarL/FixJ family response regulator